MAMKTYMTRAAACLLASCAFSTAAYAGGFARGEADTDILYEDGTFVVHGGATYVAPKRGYETINGAVTSDGDYTNDFWIPSIAAKFQFSENFSCALTYTQPYGGDVEYGSDAQNADRAADLAGGPVAPFPIAISNAVISSKFSTNEYGGTCAVNFALGPGRAYLLGGGFVQSFDYTENKDLGTLHLKDNDALGWRMGLGFEIEEYALRAQLLYRSKVEHEADGSFTPSATGTALLGALLPGVTDFTATGSGTLPQSLELSLQSGIAPDWLAFGSVKWTDWSVLQTLNYTISPIGDFQKNFFWRDGWTITAGVGHKFNETVSGAASLTWDKGVGTGADIQTDTWTLAAGTDIKAGPGVLRLGGAVSYLTSGEQIVNGSDGADFNATADGDWAYALSASYRISF